MFQPTALPYVLSFDLVDEINQVLIPSKARIWRKEWMKEWMNEWMNECLTTPQHKNKSAIGCQTNGIYIQSEN